MTDTIISILILNTNVLLLYILIDYKNILSIFKNPKFKLLDKKYQVLTIIILIIIMYVLAVPFFISVLIKEIITGYKKIKNKKEQKQWFLYM